MNPPDATNAPKGRLRRLLLIAGGLALPLLSGFIWTGGIIPLLL